MITTLTSIVNTLVAIGVVDFPANYKITSKDHVYVYYVDGEEAEVLLVQVTSFTAGTPNEYKINAITDSGFNVELRDAYDTADGRKISIRRVLPLTQEVDYPPGNDFPAATHERALDKLTAIVQQFHEEIGRQIGMPLSEDTTETNLPAFVPGSYLGLDGGNDFVWKDGTGAPLADEIKDYHIDWGTGVDQVSAEDIPIADSGSIITATEVEGALQENRTALQENRTALDLNTIHRGSDGKDHSDVILNNTHRTTHDGSIKGKAEITLSNYDNNSAPDVKSGSIFDNNGILIKITSDATPTGYAGIANSTTFYIYFDESTEAFIFDSTAPTWNDAFQGWYNGNDRAFFSMYKDSGGTLYNHKNIITNDKIRTKRFFLGSWNMDADSNRNFDRVTELGILNWDDFLSATVLIYQDNGTPYSRHPIEAGGAWFLYVNSPEDRLTIYRASSGYFDSTAFNDTSINRGTVLVTYTGTTP